MAVKFFGQYLVEKGMVSREAILKAIKLQDTVNLKFGETALSLELITSDEMARVHAAQRNEDLKFGDMAVKLGILTEPQVNQVLTVQKNSHLYLGEALVQVGALEEADLSRLLDAFKADQAPYLTEHILIPAGIPHAQLWEFFADLTAKMFARIVGVTCRLGACRVAQTMAGGAVVAAMDLTGDAGARCLLAVPARTRDDIARAILEEESVDGEPEEVLDDAVMEFLNIICGNVAAKAAREGKNLDLLPPVALHPGPEGIAVPVGSRGLFFTLHLSNEGEAEVGVFVQR